MKRMLDIPKDRPRSSRWLFPLLALLGVLFIVSLPREPAQYAEGTLRPDIPAQSTRQE